MNKKETTKAKKEYIIGRGGRIGEKKIKEIRKQEYKSIEYSDKKIKAKNAPEYSVLKPDTSSDSLSLKSKGARWVSARVQINQTGKNNRKRGEDRDQKVRIE
jgi:hypothetical protein